MYKTILVHVDGSTRSQQRVELAARLARQYQAHLVGTAVTGFAAYLMPGPGVESGMPPVLFPIEELHTRAKLALDRFEAAASSAGVDSYERRLVDDEAGMGVSLQARYSDLVIISQTTRDVFSPDLRADFPDYVLLNACKPVLVLPGAGIQKDIGRHVLVAWNGSAEAVRAITSAIPMMKLADKVSVVVFDAEADAMVHGEDPGVDMATYLARHGIKVEVVRREVPIDEGQALLSHAADSGADVIVMGAFGHSRFREYLLGGVSRTVLRESTLPLWMAH